MSQPTPTIPKGSWILVTGVTGFIASHIALEFLNFGYKVRGTVRDTTKARWVTEEMFPSATSTGEFEAVLVPDMSIEGAFDEAVQGVSAIIHVATVINWDPNPNNVVPQTIAGVLNILNSARGSPSVKRFVYTSSAGAAVFPESKTEFHADENTWNEGAVELAQAPPPYEPSRALATYMAAKVRAEKALWKFAVEEKPDFVVNSVLPFTTLGKILNKHQDGSTAKWVLDIYRGDISRAKDVRCCKIPFLDLSFDFYNFSLFQPRF